MPSRRSLSPISDQQLRTALNDAVRGSLIPLTAVLTGAFLFSCVFRAAWLRHVADVLVAVEFASAAAALAVLVAVWRCQVPDRWVHPVAFFVAMVAGANSVAQLYLSGWPGNTTNLALVVAGAGLVSLSIFWTGLIFLIMWGSWSWCVYFYPHAEWWHYGFFLMYATVVAAAIQTARYGLLRRLVQAEGRHQLLVEHLPVVSYVDEASPGGRPLYISPQIQQLLGYSPEEWLSQPDFWIDCLHVTDRERTLASFREHIKTQTPWDLEYRMLAKDGRVVWLQDRSTRGIAIDSGRPLAYGIMVDITEKKRAEALRDGANRVFERLAANAPLEEVLAVLVDAAEEIQPGMLGSVLLLDEHNCLRHAAAPSLPEFYRQAIDGTAIGPHVGSCGAAAYHGRQVIVDDIATHPDWTPYRDVALRAGLHACWSQPIFSTLGRVIGTLAMYYQRPHVPRTMDKQLILAAASLAGLAIERARTEADLTRYRKHLEELVAERTRQLEDSLEQLRHSERLASVGTLAAGIAHEINNPVGMMLLSAEQALVGAAEPDSGTDVESLLRDIVTNAKRCGQIVKRVLRFARQEPAARLADDVNVVIQNAVDLTHAYATRNGGVIQAKLAGDIPPVLLNRIELEQVFVNLIRNGIEAVDDAPCIDITSERVGQAVRVTVCDNGRGMRPEDRGRVFDPFYTTRQAHGGTGLGLSLTYGIVRDHGGTIRVESASGGGTAMIVELPLHSVDAPLPTTSYRESKHSATEVPHANA